MNKKFQQAFDSLKTLGCPVFIRADNPKGFYISTEHANSHNWADYYGEFRGGYPWENPKIETVLSPLGLACDWENPACLIVFED
jgi:hypothetical protein